MSYRAVDNWQDEHAYDFCDDLSGGQWAWEFLRRNPQYQQQWKMFRETWQALETDYGKPPDRDFCAWKNDPRAWVPASECTEGDCRIDQDKVLIECALGARWGFHKFPPNPQDDDPFGEGRLNWRKPAVQPLPTLSASERKLSDEEVALVFDLSLPLRPQIAQAKRQLQLEARQRYRAGNLEFKRVKVLRKHWRNLLQILDGLSAGDKTQVEKRFSPMMCAEADRMMQRGYLELPFLPE